MDPDSQTLINWALGAISFLLGWILNSVRQSVRDLHTQDQALADKVNAIEVLVAGTYVKRDDMDKISSAIFAKLDRIENKLDQKVDRQ